MVLSSDFSLITWYKLPKISYHLISGIKGRKHERKWQRWHMMSDVLLSVVFSTERMLP